MKIISLSSQVNKIKKEKLRKSVQKSPMPVFQLYKKRKEEGKANQRGKIWDIFQTLKELPAKNKYLMPLSLKTGQKEEEVTKEANNQQHQPVWM